ncbi:MAG: hypothetical protein F4X16_17745 [Caldilineaceae bacterium SB0661_bin_34]|nr:hypothetical protein [Caldilineaceae bacterium SB0661_bin_34]
MPASWDEYIPKVENYVRSRTYTRWFLTERDRRGRINLGERKHFKTLAQAETRRDELRDGAGRDLAVVECRVVMSILAPKNKRIQFEYRPTGETRKRAESQFEQFWREDALRRTESILWYGGEFTAMMFAGRAVFEDAETELHRDRHVIPVVLDGGRVEIHTPGLARQLQQDCRLRVTAHLFHQAVEVGMKVLAVADGIDDLRKLGHRLGDVWADVDERHRLEVNRIFNKEVKDAPPASKSFDELVAQYSKGGKGVTRRLRYLGDDPKPLPDSDIVHHLWKMATALELYYFRVLVGGTLAVHGVLTDFCDTIH